MTFILIPGRTSKQGVGISEGKFKEEGPERNPNAPSRTARYEKLRPQG